MADDIQALIEEAVAQDRRVYEASGLLPVTCYQCRDQREPNEPRLRRNRLGMVFCSETCRRTWRSRFNSLDAS